ncbi:MAG: hypothetical protein ACREB9_05205 [Thermoplasmata archaeon]
MTRGSRSSAKPARASPGVPEAIARSIESHLHEREARRERIHSEARALRRAAQGVMIHQHEGGNDPTEVSTLGRGLVALSRAVRSDGSPDAALARDAIQEAVEAILLDAIARGVALPGPRRLGVEVEPYLLGLGDVVGEVRRRALLQLAADKLEAAEASVALLDRLYQTLMRFDTTRAIVPLKPKQDTARSLLERTRGEVVLARVHARYRGGSVRRVVEERP